MARGGKRRRWPWILVAVLLIGGAATGGWAYWYDNVREVTHVVPDLVNQTEADVAPLIADGQWTVERTETRADGTVPGQILSQDPAAGTHLKEGGVLALTVSLGLPLVPLPPDLVHKTLTDATAELAAAGFSLGEVIKQFDEEVAADVVLALGPDLLPQMPKGSAVPLVVSAGPAPRTIPNLSGLTVDQARQKLEAMQLTVATRNQMTDDVPEGSLMDSDPGQGAQVAKGSTVTLIVAVPITVQVPDVRGRTAADAATVLQSKGLAGERHAGFAGQSGDGHQPGLGHRGEARHRRGHHHQLIERDLS